MVNHQQFSTFLILLPMKKMSDHFCAPPCLAQGASDCKEAETLSIQDMKQSYDQLVCDNCLKVVQKESGEVGRVLLEDELIKQIEELQYRSKQALESSAAAVQIERLKWELLKEEVDRLKNAYPKLVMTYRNDVNDAQDVIDTLPIEHLQNVNKPLEMNTTHFLKVAKVVEEKSPETQKTLSVWNRLRNCLGLRKPQWWKKTKKCSERSTPLSSDYYCRDGRLFCHEDYWAKYGQLCHGCNKTITTSLQVVADDHKYHPGCFTCLKCQTLIGDGDPYALVDESKLHCILCYCQTTCPPDFHSDSSDAVLSPASDGGQRQEEGSLEGEKQVDAPPTALLLDSQSTNHSFSSRSSIKTWTPCTDTTRKKYINQSRSLCDVSLQPLLIFHHAELHCAELLGRGSFGQVFKVTHAVTDEVMVMKATTKFDKETEKIFQNEMRIMHCLDHPNVVKFIGILYKEQTPSLIMEYAERGTLGDILEDMDLDLPWHLLVRFACDIAAGMEYVHSLNIMHRDLNPHNCLVKDDYTVLVADFGLARFMKEDKQDVMSQGKVPSLKNPDRRKQYSIVGNFVSMAPEMLSWKTYDEKVDIFSFGTILCQIIGRVGVNPSSPLRTSEFGLDVPYFLENWYPSSCPPAFFPIATLCCELDADKRPEFSTLKKWLENLKMHVQTGSPLMPELDLLQKEFWEKHREEKHTCIIM